MILQFVNDFIRLLLILLSTLVTIYFRILSNVNISVLDLISKLIINLDHLDEN